MSSPLNKNKQNTLRSNNCEITLNEKNFTVVYIGGYLVKYAPQKFPMHQHIINHLKSECLPEKSKAGVGKVRPFLRVCAAF